MRLFRVCFKENPDSVKVLINLAAIFVETHHVLEAMKCFYRIVQIDSKSLVAYCGLMILSARTCDWDTVDFASSSLKTIIDDRCPLMCRFLQQVGRSVLFYFLLSTADGLWCCPLMYRFLQHVGRSVLSYFLISSACWLKF